jgi:hypothetical protein
VDPLRLANKDILIDTNVISRAAAVHDGAYFLTGQVEGLLRRLEGITGEDPGKVYISAHTIEEFAVTREGERLSDIAYTMRRLFTWLEGRCLVGQPLGQAVHAEWHEGGIAYSADWREFADAFRTVERTGTVVGTKLERVRDEAIAWKGKFEPSYRRGREEFKDLYRSDASFRQSVNAGLGAFKRPEVYESADYVAKILVVEDAKLPVERLANAYEHPDDYLVTWTFSVLILLAQFVSTTTKDERRSVNSSLAAFEPRPSDFMDAAIVASAARCGLFLSEDDDLRKRCSLLSDSRLGRIQALPVFGDLNNPPIGDLSFSAVA